MYRLSLFELGCAELTDGRASNTVRCLRFYSWCPSPLAACEKLVVHMRSEVDRLAERDAVWAKRDAEMNAALKAAERQLAELNAAGTAPAAAEVCADSNPSPSFNLFAHQAPAAAR